MTAKRDGACLELKRQANLSGFKVSLVYIKFQNSQGYREKPCFKEQTTTKAILVRTQDKTHSQLFRDNIVVY